MDKNEYHIQLTSIFNLAALVRRLKIADVLEAIHRAETAGALLAPTTYIKAATSLEWQRKTAEAALQFQQAIEEIASNPRYSQQPRGKR